MSHREDEHVLNDCISGRRLGQDVKKVQISCRGQTLFAFMENLGAIKERFPAARTMATFKEPTPRQSIVMIIEVPTPAKSS